jgi:hypothetical protein
LGPLAGYDYDTECTATIKTGYWTSTPARAREFCETVEQLQKVSNEVEAFIHALDETGRVHRGCERSRSQVDKHLTGHGY